MKLYSTEIKKMKKIIYSSLLILSTVTLAACSSTSTGGSTTSSTNLNENQTDSFLLMSRYLGQHVSKELYDEAVDFAINEDRYVHTFGDPVEYNASNANLLNLIVKSPTFDTSGMLATVRGQKYNYTVPIEIVNKSDGEVSLDTRKIFLVDNEGVPLWYDSTFGSDVYDIDIIVPANSTGYGVIIYGSDKKVEAKNLKVRFGDTSWKNK